MSAVEIVLALWAVLCLGVFGIVGRWQAEDWRWKWADPVYYPLAIAGILLLFLNNENARAIAELRVQRTAIEAELQVERTKKPIEVGETGAGSLAKSYALIASEARSIKSCTAVLFEKCQFQRDQLTAIEKAFKDFQAPSDPRENVATASQARDYCARGNRLVDLLAENTMSGEVFSALRAALTDQRARSRAGLGAEGDAATKQSLRSNMLDVWTKTSKKFGDDTRGILYFHWQADSGFAELVFDALAMCARLADDAVARLAERDQHNAVLTRLEGAKKDKDDAIAGLQGAVATTWFERLVNFAQTKLWPFVLVLALALKFGKGVAGLRPSETENEVSSPPPGAA